MSGEALKTIVTFRSDRFPAEEGEEWSEENPPDEHFVPADGVAEFLAEGLRARGFVVEDPYAAEGRYHLEIENDEFDLWIECALVDDFLVIVYPGEPVIRKWFGRDISTVARIQPVLSALKELLAGEGFSNVTWYTQEEFDRPYAQRSG